MTGTAVLPVLALAAGSIIALTAAPVAGTAQPLSTRPLVAILSRGPASPEERIVSEFRQGLRELGWIEGQNVRVEIRYAEWRPERLEPLAAGLIQLKPDVLWTHSNTALRIVARLTTTIPVVSGASSGVLELGLARSLARPGGNVTGMSILGIELEPKRVEVLRDALPRLRRLGILALSPRSDRIVLGKIEDAARAARLDVVYVRVVTPADIEGAVATLARDRAEAAFVQDGPVFGAEGLARVATAALQHRLPTVSGVPGFAAAGGLLQYGSDRLDGARRSAGHVDRILRGAKAADLPIEQPTKFKLIVNLKTAKALGLTIPESVLLRADELIQ